jgi:hypothetical protein
VSSAYAQKNSDGTYTNNDGWLKGNIELGATQRPGTTWVKFTVYYNLPSSTSAFDGKLKVWVNNQLIIDLWGAGLKDSGSLTKFTKLSFYSSSEAGEFFEHWMDEMVIFEGYVPPDGSKAPIETESDSPVSTSLPSAPEDFKAGS